MNKRREVPLVLFLIAWLFLPLFTLGAQANNRFALVIGNNNYLNGVTPLSTPVNDVTDISVSLRELGYSVTVKTNLDLDGMIDSVKEFVVKLKTNRDSEGFFWFAGHGITVRERHYLLPVNVNPQDEARIERGGYSVDELVGEFEGAVNKVNLIVIDACRTNFVPGQRALSGRGLSVVSGSRRAGNKIVYSTQPSTTASDGTPGSRNSPFARAFLDNMRTPDAFENVFIEINDATLRLTQGQQMPYPVGTFGIRNYSIHPAGLQAAVQSAAVPQSAAVIPAPAPPQPAPEGAALVLDGRRISLPRLLSVNTLGAYELGRGETIERVLTDRTRTAYSLIYRTGSDYYVRQGNRGFGPFPYVNYDSRSWNAKNRQGQYFIGSAGITNGPISDPGIEAIRSVEDLADRRLAYVADISNNQNILQTGLRREGPYDWLGSIHIAPVTGKIAYGYSSHGRAYLMIDGKSLGPFTSANFIGWSSDGQKCAYTYFEENSGHTLVYGGYSYTSPKWLDNSFAPDGKTLVFKEGTILHQIGDTGVEKKINANGEIGSWRVSNDGRRTAYSCFTDNYERRYIVLVRPDGSQRTYGPFQGWTLSFSFSPNSEIFFCTGKEAATGRQVVYANDEKYAVNEGDIIPVFSAQENKYAAYMADISYDNFLLYTDMMTVEIIPEMESAVLPDGTPVYWTIKDGGAYLNVSYDAYGPFDYAANLSDAVTINWLVCHDGSIQIISVKR